MLIWFFNWKTRGISTSWFLFIDLVNIWYHIWYISVTGAGRPQIYQIHNAILIHILNLIDCQATSIVRGTSDHTFGGLPSGTSFCPKFKKCLYYDFATNAVYESYLIVGCFRIRALFNCPAGSPNNLFWFQWLGWTLWKIEFDLWNSNKLYLHHHSL